MKNYIAYSSNMILHPVYISQDEMLTVYAHPVTTTHVSSIFFSGPIRLALLLLLHPSIVTY